MTAEAADRWQLKHLPFVVVDIQKKTHVVARDGLERQELRQEVGVGDGLGQEELGEVARRGRSRCCLLLRRGEQRRHFFEEEREREDNESESGFTLSSGGKNAALSALQSGLLVLLSSNQRAPRRHSLLIHSHSW